MQSYLKKNIMWELALNNILANYIPVRTVEESDEQYSTRELQQLLEDHTGASVKLEELYNALLEANFDYTLQGQNMLWLFKKIKK